MLGSMRRVIMFSKKKKANMPIELAGAKGEKKALRATSGNQ